MYFKPRTITISLEPRDFPPVVEPEVEWYVISRKNLCV
jgi:hypothetical protein